jgi:ketosteroid isomerase-like protein
MSDAIAKDIATIIKGIFDAFMNHTPGGIEDHMDPESTIWDVFTPHLIRGKAERDKFHADDQAQMQARGALTLTVEPPVVDSWGDTALARYYLNFAYQPPNATKGRVRITNVFRFKGGKWWIVHHHEGMVPTGVPPIGEKKA